MAVQQRPTSNLSRIRVEVVTDSRGVGLQNELNLLNDRGFDITVLIKKGCGLIEAVRECSKRLVWIAPDLVIIAVGICDITRKDRESKMVSLQDDSIEAMVLKFEASMDTIDHHLKVKLMERAFKLVFCHITGMDIGRYNKLSVRHPQQDRLDEMIPPINQAITTFNVNNGVLTPWLAKDIHMNISKQKGKKACRYHRLAPDGLHLTDALREKWAGVLYKAITNLSDGTRPAQYSDEARNSLHCLRGHSR